MNDEYDPLDLLSSLVTKQGSSDIYGAMQTITIRMPLDMASTFDALAEYAGVSRNKIMVTALEVAIDRLMKSLSDADRSQIDKLAALTLKRRLDAFSSGNEQPEISEI